jgi:LPXTG-motif cell wall-anchored protein
VNTATAVGTPPVGSPITDTGSAIVTAANGPAVSIAKSTTATTFTAVGQRITFTIVARNTGNVTLTNLVITDPNAVMGTCNPAAPAVLSPGQSMTCTAVHTVTAADLNALSISNTAFVAGEEGVLDVAATSNAVSVRGVGSGGIPAAGSDTSQVLKFVGLLLISGSLLFVASRRRRLMYLESPPL